ncbi:MAG TPA: hypothetical protein VFE47_23140 [Tepidisphaeraceae bacterium]|nr:hypothetical protein [Tepidisphaeraceae bacterium]
MAISRQMACLIILMFAATGCQSSAPTVSNRILIAHLPGVDFSGLKPMHTIGTVKVECSVPDHWKTLRLDRNSLYTHQQWKSPSGATGTGVVYASLPFPLSAKTLLWFAKLEYSKATSGTGEPLGQWTDSLGRPWFEAENEKYHVKGYAVVNGANAWIVYYGYKIARPVNPSEMSVAARFVDTIIPQSGEARSD